MDYNWDILPIGNSVSNLCKTYTPLLTKNNSPFPQLTNKKFFQGNPRAVESNQLGIHAPDRR